MSLDDRPETFELDVQEEGDKSSSITLRTRFGPLRTVFHPVPSSACGVVYVGGVGGGVHGPADSYPELCEKLQEDGVAGLRVDFRNARSFRDCIVDTLLGVEFLRSKGCNRFGAVGHSMGGAVVINAALSDPQIETIVCLATQSYGADRIRELQGRSLLFLHGEKDPILPPDCSHHLFGMVKGLKELKVYEHGTHCFEQVRGQMITDVEKWLRDRF